MQGEIRLGPAKKKDGTGVVSTINGGKPNVPFYREARQPGHIKGEPTFHGLRSPSRSARRTRLASTPRPLIGHLAAWELLPVIRRPSEKRRSSSRSARGATTTETPKAAVTNDRWKKQHSHRLRTLWYRFKAVEGRAQSGRDADKVIDAAARIEAKNLDRGHLERCFRTIKSPRPVFIGAKIKRANGQFETGVERTPGPGGRRWHWSKEIEGSKDLESARLELARKKCGK